MANSSRKGRIGRTNYWIAFAAYLVAVVVLGAAAFYFMLQLNLGIAIASFLIIAPLGIYFRILMMRRCRDIGWPASLPWLIFATSMGASLFGGLGSLGAGLGSPPGIKGLLIGGFGLPLLISLIDLGFTILIGCIPTKEEATEDYARIFGEDSQPARPQGYREPILGDTRREPAPAGDYSSFDAAVARALEAHRAAEAESMAEPFPASRAGAPVAANAHARAVAGFGRKAV